MQPTIKRLPMFVPSPRPIQHVRNVRTASNCSFLQPLWTARPASVIKASYAILKRTVLERASIALLQFNRTVLHSLLVQLLRKSVRKTDLLVNRITSNLIYIVLSTRNLTGLPLTTQLCSSFVPLSLLYIPGTHCTRPASSCPGGLPTEQILD